MHAYLIGICGTAMANLALMLKESGWDVSGSDRFCYPPMGPLLQSRGISILPGWNGDNLAECPLPDLVVVGNVCRRDNPEVLVATTRGARLRSMPQVLDEVFLSPHSNFVVTGTHGKTTVTSLTSWLLESAGRHPGFLVGGIPLNFDSGYRLGAGTHFVIEGDEYDTAFFDKQAKFFHYRPRYAVMTSLEFDHADIYRDLSHLEDTFRRFAALIPRDGVLARCSEYPVLEGVTRDCPGSVWTYGFQPRDTVWAESLEAGPMGTEFLFHTPDGARKMLVPLWGEHNVLNALAALSLGLMAGVPVDELSRGLSTFRGVKRRLQLLGDVAGMTLVDDFAHHPTAVRETVKASRIRFPGRRLLALYHFESNTSRRKVFEQAYGEAFRGADMVLLTHPLKKDDGLAPEATLDPHAVARAIAESGSRVEVLGDFDALAAKAAEWLRPGDVLVGMSGRDLTPVYEKLMTTLQGAAG